MIKKITQTDELNNLTHYKITINEFTNLYGYFIDNELVGFIDFSLIFDRIELNYLYVLDRYRNKGIASKLMDVMLKLNLDITLEVNVNNKDAINLYKKYGFEVLTIREKYYNGIDGYLMGKKQDFLFLNKYNLDDVLITDISILIKKNYVSIYNYNESELYDLASLTKLFTLNLIYNLKNENKIDLNNKISDYLTTKLDISILDILKMKHYIKLNKNLKDCSSKDEILKTLLDSSILEERPHYNDIGFLILGFLIEKVTNISLQKNFENLFNEYNLNNTKVNPVNYVLLGNGNDKALPNDFKTRINEGISGAAGIFSNVKDLYSYLDKIVNYEVFDKSFVDEIFDYNFIDHKDRNRTYAGLYKLSTTECSYVKKSKYALAHQGFTGTWFVFDFETKNIAIILTNSMKNNELVKHPNHNEMFLKLINEINI